MTSINLVSITRTYKNNGQHAEQVVRYTLGGTIEKADNRSHTLGGDYEDIQIKSARATVCKGNDIRAYLANDGANRYGYVTSDFSKMFIMNREEWIIFTTEFGTVTRESSKNGGGIKIRLKEENTKMIQFLNERG